MSVGFIILLIIIFLIMFGAGQRVLDRMRMNDIWAIVLLSLIAIGLIIPPIRITSLFEFSIGGFLIPFGICIYLLIRVGWSRDLIRAGIGTIITAGLIIGLEFLLPADPEELWIDPMFLYGIVAGLTAYILGRSRRNAMICSIFGITLAKLIIFIINLGKDTPILLSLGGAGVFDAMIISVLLAVGLCELIGESLERICGEQTKKKRDFVGGRFVEKKPILKEREETK